MFSDAVCSLIGAFEDKPSQSASVAVGAILRDLKSSTQPRTDGLVGLFIFTFLIFNKIQNIFYKAVEDPTG